MRGLGHSKALRCPPPKLREVVSALSCPRMTPRGHWQEGELVSDAVSSPDPESCPTRVALGRLRCLTLNCDSAEEGRKGGGAYAGAQKGFASHFSLSKAQPVPRNEGTQNHFVGPWVPQSAHLKGTMKTGEAPVPCLLLGSFYCLKPGVMYLAHVLCSQVRAVDSGELSETRSPDSVAATEAGWKEVPPGQESWESLRLQELSSQHRK